ncbi:8df80fa0-5d92-491f-b7d2-a140f94e442b [Sclerotinia trifoliorum]|uniref:8df80fa0-5d92-491f-b7d2-a140f94e442b n=1 Tax=Sclerotinia trifoliorum TaxID=28548 RepID=A0A8H2VNR9_9HELO|nr:8df80fa0-5d92-491f-b7d2-a140f94e442b [Sclerotinia trifoliorum]
MSQLTINKRWTTRQSGLQDLILGSSTVPTPGDGQVLVKIHTVALNYRDTEVMMGLYNHHKTAGNVPSSLVPCSDISGTIISSNSSKWKPGDRVLAIFNQTHIHGQVTAKDMASGLGLPAEGCLQEYRVFDGEGLVRRPEYLTDEEACTLPIAGVTAWMAINGMRPLGQPAGKGESVLILGTGGVAISGLQIAKASGMEVIITSSSDTKLAQAKSLGADHTINYRTHPKWSDEVMKITQGEGVSNIFETGGALTLRQSFDAIAFGGLINCIGYLSGKEDEDADRTNTNVLALRRNVTLKGILNGPRERFEEMLAWYEEKRIRPVVDRVFGFEEAKEALEYLFHGAHFGKVVVRVSE